MAPTLCSLRDTLSKFSTDVHFTANSTKASQLLLSTRGKQVWPCRDKQRSERLGFLECPQASMHILQLINSWHYQLGMVKLRFKVKTELLCFGFTFYCSDKTLGPKPSWRGMVLSHFTAHRPSLRKIRTESQVRNMGARTEGDTGFLPMAYLASFLIFPRNSCPGVEPTTVNWALPHQLLIKKNTT